MSCRRKTKEKRCFLASPSRLRLQCRLKSVRPTLLHVERKYIDSSQLLRVLKDKNHVTCHVHLFFVGFLIVKASVPSLVSHRLQTMTPTTSILISQWRFPSSLRQTKICFSLWIKDNSGASLLSILTLALSIDLPTCTIVSELYNLLSHSENLQEEECNL